MDANDKKQAASLIKKLKGSGQVNSRMIELLCLICGIDEPQFNKEDRKLKNWKKTKKQMEDEGLI